MAKKKAILAVIESEAHFVKTGRKMLCTDFIVERASSRPLRYSKVTLTKPNPASS